MCCLENDFDFGGRQENVLILFDKKVQETPARFSRDNSNPPISLKVGLPIQEKSFVLYIFCLKGT